MEVTKVESPTKTEVKVETVKPVEKVKPKAEPEKKTVYVEITPPKPKVTFTGTGWCAVEIKLVCAAIVKGFKEMLRELYRKEYEKK